MILSRIEVYKDTHDEWRFRAIALNGEIVSVGEGYVNQIDCIGEAAKLWPDEKIEVRKNADA